MAAVIVCFSLNGNTAYAAEEISSALGADTLRIEPKKNYPEKGFAKFLVGGGDVVAKRRPPLEPYSIDLSKYDRVIIAGPVWASCFAPPIGTFIEENREALADKRISCVYCSAGGDTAKAVKRLKDALGKESFEAELFLIDPKTRPSEANSAAIKEFINKLS